MPTFESVFYEIAALLAVASVVGAIGVWLRQPLIVSFIAAGILVGPSGFEWVGASDQVELLAKMGIALLLFVVGLKLDLHIIRTLGLVALATGLGQVFFTSVIGYLIAIALGMTPVTALYVAVALTFSSTIIIVKLLSDKKEIDALHGRIAVGFLIVQDIVVVLVMIGLAALGVGTSAESGGIGVEMLYVLFKGLAMLVVVALLMRYVLPWLTRHLARSVELLVLFAIAWAVLLASIGDALGFSKEVGAFLAGVSLASTPFRETIGARLVGLRDFLLLFFFIDLGAGLEIATLGDQLGSAIILSLFVLIGNPLIVLIIMGVMGYRKRTSFLAGLTVAQISEFSLIMIALGLSLGHVEVETVGLVTLVGLITISGSTYMILYSHVLYEKLAPWLSIFERKHSNRETAYDGNSQGDEDMIVLGLGRYGRGVSQLLKERGYHVLGVDFDPETIRTLQKDGYVIHYGDAEDPEFLGSLPLDRVKWVISTAPEIQVNLALLQGLVHHSFAGKVAVTAHNHRDALLLKQAGADLVLRPYADAAKEGVDRLLSLPFAKQESDH
ncbi:MAG: cation:proton antiporter [Gammaproteobacteria bacterium]|nr:cation:proton antiporter [Gammaproteobacteria bacterium]